MSTAFKVCVGAVIGVAAGFGFIAFITAIANAFVRYAQ